MGAAIFVVYINCQSHWQVKVTKNVLCKYYWNTDQPSSFLQGSGNNLSVKYSHDDRAHLTIHMLHELEACVAEGVIDV